MKNIEEIREKLGPDYRVEENDGVITVCSIWDGVEYVRCVGEYDGQFSEGGIYRIKTIEGVRLYFHNDDEGRLNSRVKERFTPATEDEYVEHLKKEAKKRFVEIKDGDRLDITDIAHSGYASVQLKAYPTFTYIKQHDELSLNGFCLYRKGKWAKKIEERVKVEVEDWKITTNAEFKSFDFTVEMRVESSRPFDPNESAVYLAKCLKEYINKS